MSASSSLQIPEIKPLSDNAQIIDLLVGVTEKSRLEVIRKFLDEEREFPYNVRTECKQKNIPQGEWTPQLLEFYGETEAFLYANFVWSRNPLKVGMRNWIAKFLHRVSARPQKVLCYGDGLGIESVFFALLGHEVTYFEISKLSQKVVRELVSLNGVDVEILSDESSIQPESYDAIVCLDVLEHVPSPPQEVEKFSRWLKPNGMLIVNAPFFLVTPIFPTHLKSNLKYSGDFKSLYRPHSFELLDGQFFWAPIAMAKTPDATTRKQKSRWGLFSVFWGGIILKIASVSPWLLIRIVFVPLRRLRSKVWLRDLERLQHEESSTTS